MKLKVSFVFTLILFTSNLLALPKHLPVPGGVSLLTLEGEFLTKPLVFYQNKPTLVIPLAESSSNEWLAVIGIPLSAKAGQHTVSIKTTEKSIQQSFLVLEKSYPEQRIQVQNSDHVSPKKQQVSRIQEEAKQINAALSAFHPSQNPIPLALTWPLEGRHSGRFGLKRFFNDQPRSPHSGYDIAAPEGTPIRAPLDGKVTLVGDFFFTGNFVVLDHGEGFQTLYAHLQKTLVEEGQNIKQGETLGKVGKTGRATGPHLHWGVVLNTAKVDPSLFVE